MKYAFVIGSNAFIVPHGVISCSNGDATKEILRVNSVHRDNEPGSRLSVDIDIEDSHGNHIQVNNNTMLPHGNLQLIHDHDLLRIVGTDERIIFNIQQMDRKTWEALEHNIVAELEMSEPIAVLRVFGDFRTEGLHIMAENEKLYINDNGYATSAMYGHNDLQFTDHGVVLD